MTRPHLTEEMLDFLRTEFGSTNISGTANALLIIGMYAVGVQPPADEIPRLLRRSDIPSELAAYVRAIGANPDVPASPLLSPQVMTIMNQLLAGVQALTSTPWRIPPTQAGSSEAAVAPSAPRIATQPTATPPMAIGAAEAQAEEQDVAAVQEPEPQPEPQPEPLAALPTVPPAEEAAPVVEQPPEEAAPVAARPAKERRRVVPPGRQRAVVAEAGQPVENSSILVDAEPEPALEPESPVVAPPVIVEAVPEEDAEPVAVLAGVPAEGPTPPAPPAPPKKRSLGRAFQG